MNPSITRWNRIEPRPRSPDLAEALAARIRDPLWMLTRQWQLGELQGEDAGSPTFVEVDGRVARIDRVALGDGPFAPLPAGAPLERLVEAEPFAPDLSVRVELGQTFEALLDAEGAAALVPAFRAAYPLPERRTLDPRDADALRFLDLCAGRAIDGVALYLAARRAGGLPATPVVDARLVAAATAAANALVHWVDDVFGAFGRDDAPAWDASRLSYRVQVAASGPGGGVALSAQAGRDGSFDWYAFDVTDRAPALAPAETRAFAAAPMHVRFRGMPNARWWDFEPGTTDFGAIEPQKRDLAKLMVMDFLLVHGNDWFVVPFPQDIGTLSWLESLLVHDVFGGVTLVDRADAGPVASPLERWTLYSTAASADGAGIAPFFVLPPSPAAALQPGPTLEEVRFFRDEMAELVWAIERTTESAIGTPWSGHERSVASAPTAPAPSTAPLHYRIETTVPESWIPFVPVAIDAATGEVALQRARLLRAAGDAPVLPFGRILRPGAPSYVLAEHEVPREGTRITRLACRSRWIDGSTHMWLARRRSVGAGEGDSGLRYDVASPAPP
jgi:hypothetical protein